MLINSLVQGLGVLFIWKRVGINVIENGSQVRSSKLYAGEQFYLGKCVIKRDITSVQNGNYAIVTLG